MRARRGSASVELALVLPLFLVLVTGLADGAWLFYNHGVLARSLRAGCRAGAVVDAESDPEAAATAAIEGLLADWRYACPAEESCVPEVALTTDAQDRDVLTCRLSVPFQGLTGLVLPVGDLHLTAATRVHVEQWEHP
ncbi:MAG: TadE/TadG family type IV pilus assembly protein [Pseudomonadota bacterium]